MAFLRAHGFYIGIGVICLASLGGGGWAYMSGADVEQRMEDINGLVGTVKRLQGNPANKRIIDAKKKEAEEKKAAMETSKAEALALLKNNPFYEQIDGNGNVTRVPRQLLVRDVLPKAKPAVRFAFREAYKQAFQELHERLRGRAGPTEQEIQRQRILLEQIKRPQDEQPDSPWIPRLSSSSDTRETSYLDRSLTDLLRESPSARAADEVARSIYMYIEDGAFGMHDLVNSESAPTSVGIWQAQMAFWIQQDMAAALARCNEERAEELKRQGVKGEYWVGQMPVKHLKKLVIGDVLGEGGGSNLAGETLSFSFTDVENNDKMFVVPLQLELVIEEAAVMNVLEKLCSVGLYTPIAVKYVAVKPDPTLFFRLYIYGEEPIVQIEIDLEGYYFREAFEQWIPKDLKEILTLPGAKEGYRGGRG